MRRQLFLVVLALVGLIAPACHGADESLPVRVTGRLVDDETGKPVSRDTIWVHGYNDEILEGKHALQVTDEPDDDSSFALKLATPNVRLLIADKSDTYERFERKYTATNEALDVEVRLKPTHWILLHGKALWRDGPNLRPIHEGDGNVSKAMISIGRQHVETESDGSYSVRVPRETLTVMTINTNRAANPRTIDLRGVTDAERQIDLILEVRTEKPK